MTTTLAKIRKKLETATRAVTEEVASLRQEIAERQEELRRVKGAAVPREEIPQRVELAVKQAAETWRRNTPGIIYGRRQLGDPELAQGEQIDVPIFDQGLPWGAVCAGAPELARSILQGIADTTEYEEGPPSSERSDLVAKLTTQLEELEKGEEKLVDELIAAGVSRISHRPEVLRRREEEAHQRDLEERRRKARAELTGAAPDASVARVGRSQYLES